MLKRGPNPTVGAVTAPHKPNMKSGERELISTIVNCRLVTHDVCHPAAAAAPNDAPEGVITVTNFRVTFRYAGKDRTGGFEDVTIHYTNIIRYEKDKVQIKGVPYDCISFELRDLRTEIIAIPVQGHPAKTLMKVLAKKSNPKSPKEVFAFQHALSVIPDLDGWFIYDPVTEFVHRQSVLMDGEKNMGWRFQDANTEYALCESYPNEFLVPMGISNEVLLSVSRDHSRGRIPTLTWQHKANKSILARCSTLNPSMQEMIGGVFIRGGEDEDMVKLLRASCADTREVPLEDVWLYVINTGQASQIQASAELQRNYANCEFHNIGLKDSSTVKEAMLKVKELCNPSSGKLPEGREWVDAIRKTGWLNHIGVLIAGAYDVANKLEAGDCVVVESTTGMDACSQVVALAQLISDPFYRTVGGFGCLIEKDWLSFGHTFTDIAQKPKRGLAPIESSTLFIQFLDAVWQLWAQFPTKFEFNERLLVFIADQVYSGCYGTFLFTFEKERNAMNLEATTTSMWSYVFVQYADYLNPHYVLPNGNEGIQPVCDPDRLLLWNGYFLRFSLRSKMCKAYRQIQSMSSRAGAAKELQLNVLSLPALPDADTYLKQMVNLRKFNLCDNKLNAIPLCIFTLKSLEEILLDDNQISFFPVDIIVLMVEKLPRLRRISLNDNRIKSLPSEFALLADRLTSLCLSGNALYSMPAFESFTKLEELGLGGAVFSGQSTGGRGLGTALGAQRSSTMTNLGTGQSSTTGADNGWSSGPGSKSQQRLTMEPGLLPSQRPPQVSPQRGAGHWKVSAPTQDAPDSPTSGSRSPSTKSPGGSFIGMSGNRPTSMDAADATAYAGSIQPQREVTSLMMKLTDIGQLFNLKKLDINSIGINQLPPGLMNLTRLESLNIAGNRFRTLPAELGRGAWKSLRELNLSKNPLGMLPTVLFSMPYLVDLNISSMRLSSMNPDIQQLTSLQRLNIGHNEFTEIPMEVLELGELTRLDVSYNQIRTVPLDIFKLAKLTSLFLQSNKLTFLSPGVGKLRDLGTLDIRDNEIVHVPGVVGFLPLRSETFRYSGNKLRTPPKSVREKGHTAVMAYLKELLEGAKPCYRMKMMLVGQENVGKTSLLRCLSRTMGVKKKEEKKVDINTISTDGIDIGELQLNVAFGQDAEKETVTLSAWDFAGQELYYTSHQFFLSERSLCILVWNMAEREELSKVEFWLQSISARCPESPIIIVGTHLDDPICTKEYVAETVQFMQDKYFEKFPSLQDVVPLSCQSLRGMDQLKLLIEMVIANQEHMGEEVPLNYLELEKLVLDMKVKRVPPIMTWDEFTAIGVMCNIKTQESLLVATSLLHKLGSMLHFPSKELNDLVILSPQWLTDVMCSIITTKHNFAGTGILQHNSLQQVWRPPAFPESLHQTLFTLLQQFEIIFYLKSTQKTGPNSLYTGYSLVPSSLPEERPTDLDRHWPAFSDEPFFGRHYQLEFLPHGFVSRLMVRLLHFAEPTSFWRYGMLIVTEKGEKVLIEMKRRSMLLTVGFRNVKTSSNLSRLLLEGIGSLLDGWFNIKYKVLVPCIHCLQERFHDPYIFTLEDCELAAIQGSATINCSGVRPIRLDDLVPDIAMTNVSNCKINYCDLQVGDEIGEGGYATVYRGYYQGEEVAIKKIKFGDEDETDAGGELEAFSEFRREVWIMSGLQHQNIVPLTGFSMDPYSIVTEFLPHGNVFEYIHDEKNELGPRFMMRLATDIAKGCAFMHGMTPPVIHRDLKTPNVLVASRSETASVVAKVADFGTCQALASTTKGRTVANPVWLAPEIMNSEEYTEKADVYSYGVMLWELVTRKEFFKEISFMSALEQAVIDGKRPEIPDDCLPEYRSLIEDCWAGNPEDRPSFAECVTRCGELMTRYFPDLVTVALAEEKQKPKADGMRRVKDLLSKKKKQVNEKERVVKMKKEQDMARREKLKSAQKKKLEDCLGLLTPKSDLPGSVQCLENVKEDGKGGAIDEVWCGLGEGTIVVWNAQTKAEVCRFQGHAGKLFSLRHFGDYVWSAGEDNVMKMWSVKTKKSKKDLKLLECSCISSHGKYVYAGCLDGSVKVIDAKAGKQKKSIKIEGTSNIGAVAVTDTYVWIGGDQHIYRVNSKTNKLVDELKGHTKTVNRLLPRNNELWSCSNDKTIRVWDVNTGDCLKVLEGHTGQVFDLHLDAGHNRILSSAWDKSVMVWHADQKTFVKEYSGVQKDAVSCMVIVRGELWCGSWDATVCAWKL
eukprot:TRINITY_DN3225_c0_g1_i1.p1 TRINITY_DN3225_c0_g1~~TRINITY_DN3225_c0_g1_i1.p1  ORF type:complete len:2234 (+),score=480.91 TRINITY_DN3225_c0_g1_i1:263-6964(+)